MNTPLEFQIKLAATNRAAYLIVLNLSLTAILCALLIYNAEPNSSVTTLVLVFDSASCLAVLAMFIAAATIKVTLASRPILLSSLFILQAGNVVDAASHLFITEGSNWLNTGDALILIGELGLAVVAFRFVRAANELTNRDPLTGLYNRSHHMRHLSRLLRECHEKKQSVAVVAIDLDHFKHINDVYGHGYGDTVLQTVATVLKEQIAGADLISRTGGEEFEIVISNTDETAAKAFAEKVRATINAIPTDKLESLSASLGVAVSHLSEGLPSLRERADAAAYQAKNSGRNRVFLAN
ncbi:MAG: GGDEF domain-containing protein [Pseudomonadales bacterium]|nr:GGDEF domain-containing protein [Pseudomonadales bacterium]